MAEELNKIQQVRVERQSRLLMGLSEQEIDAVAAQAKRLSASQKANAEAIRAEQQETKERRERLGRSPAGRF